MAIMCFIYSQIDIGIDFLCSLVKNSNANHHRNGIIVNVKWVR